MASVACPNCDTLVPAGQKFCGQCGHPIGGARTQQLPLIDPSNQARVAGGVAANPLPTTYALPTRRANIPLIVGLVLAALLLLCGGGAFALLNQKTPTATPTPALGISLPVATMLPTPTHPPNPPISTATLVPPTDTVLPPSPTSPPATPLPPSPTAPPVPTSMPAATIVPTATATITLPTPTATPAPSGSQPDDITTISDVNPLVESDHPYTPTLNKSWVVYGTDAQAGATRLHFTQIDLEENVDWLIVLDAEDSEMQRFTGHHPGGFWTEPVPGTVVKLRLITDASVEQWGFAVDKMAGARYKTLAYSPHPYPAGSTRKWQFNNTDPNAQGTRLHFARLDLEDNVDWLVISGLDGSAYQWITGHHPDGLWTSGVPGNMVNMQLVSDASVEDWGFNIDAQESASLGTAQGRPEPTVLVESKHPYTAEPQTSTLVNPDTRAVFTKVHFTRLDISVGQLTLLDANDNQVQIFGESTHKKDFWSDDVPGRVVKIRFQGTDYTDWGFRIDKLGDNETR